MSSVEVCVQCRNVCVSSVEVCACPVLRHMCDQL